MYPAVPCNDGVTGNRWRSPLEKESAPQTAMPTSVVAFALSQLFGQQRTAGHFGTCVQSSHLFSGSVV